MTTDSGAATPSVDNRMTGPASLSWQTLLDGNLRFAQDRPEHPRQSTAKRLATVDHQHPLAAVFGCSDSRVTAEILFDVGIGDLFVVRNAGLVASTEAIGSLEYAVAVLRVPLIVLLTHDGCGAVNAALASADEPSRSHVTPLGRLVDGLQPAVEAARAHRNSDSEEVRRHHRRLVAQTLALRSRVIDEAVSDGRLDIIGANYRPTTGGVTAHSLHHDARI